MNINTQPKLPARQPAPAAKTDHSLKSWVGDAFKPTVEGVRSPDRYSLANVAERVFTGAVIGLAADGWSHGSAATAACTVGGIGALGAAAVSMQRAEQTNPRPSAAFSDAGQLALRVGTQGAVRAAATMVVGSMFGGGVLAHVAAGAALGLI